MTSMAATVTRVQCDAARVLPHRFGEHAVVAIQVVLFIFLLAALTACTSINRMQSAPPNAQQWQQHQQTMQALMQWQLSGKVAMRNGINGGQADVFWKQTDAKNYEIKLVAPFGAGSSVLTADATQVMLAFSNGDGMVASSVDEILQEMPDWTFPVSGLRYWLLGINSPESPAQMHWNEQGELALLEQDGWEIELQNYAPSGAYSLPKKITMRRQDHSDVSLKLLVRQWTLP
jgi:outer membrane lipoprotein LolB